MNLRIPRVAALLALVFVVALPSVPADAKLWEDKALNVSIRVPDEPYPWEWLPYSNAFKKYEIVRAAQRVVKELRSGQPGAGEGARLDLAVRTAPKGATLAATADDKKIQKYFLDRFKQHGDIDISEATLYGDVPAKLITVDGQSNNFNGKLSACNGRMIVVLLRGKIYLMRMYAWHTEYDEEGLRADLDYMEVEGIEFLNNKEDAKASTPKPDEQPGADKPEEVGKEETIWLEDHLLEIVKHERLKPKEIDRQGKRANMILAFEGTHAAGAYQLFVYATPSNRIVNGVQAGAEDIQTGITQTWYKRYLVSHPIGTIYRYKWPRKGQFLTIPDMTDENRVVQFDGKRKKRVNRPSKSEVFKLGIVDKVKGARIGDTKTSQAFRGNMQGNQKGIGRVTTLRHSWATKTHTYRTIITFSLDGHKIFADAVRKTLESIKIFKKAKDRKTK